MSLSVCRWVNGKFYELLWESVRDKADDADAVEHFSRSKPARTRPEHFVGVEIKLRTKSNYR